MVESQVVRRARQLEHIELEFRVLGQEMLRLATQRPELATKRLQLLASLRVDVATALDADLYQDPEGHQRQ